MLLKTNFCIIVGLLVCLFLTACTMQLPLNINQTRAYVLEGSNGSVLLKAGISDGFVHISHQLSEGGWNLNVDSIKLLVADTQQNIIKHNCKKKPCIAITPKSENLFVVHVPIKGFSKKTVYLFPCNYLTCNGKNLTDTLRIQRR